MRTAVKAVPPFLRALGRRPFPPVVQLPRGRYRLKEVFKHDFFAATALYRCPEGHEAVLKFGRRADVLGLPAAWIGRYLVRREARIYAHLSGVEGVPALVGRPGKYVFAHEYVPGRPLKKDEQVRDTFFEELEILLGMIHRRGLAYVDLEKCENIIVGNDGRPYLIDFQISWPAPNRWVDRFPPTAWLRRVFQHMDHYHLIKHKRRLRPDLLSADVFEKFKPPLYIRVHRAMVKPLQKFRRHVLRRLDASFDHAPR